MNQGPIENAYTLLVIGSVRKLYTINVEKIINPKLKVEKELIWWMVR
jgi:hypothetical protein